LDTLDPRNGTPAPSPQSVQPITAATRRARHLACNISREAGSFRGAIRSGKSGQSGIGGPVGIEGVGQPDIGRPGQPGLGGVRSVRSGRPDIRYRARPGNPVPGVQVSRASEAPGQSGIGAIRYGKSGQSGTGSPGNPVLGDRTLGIEGLRVTRYWGVQVSPVSGASGQSGIEATGRSGTGLPTSRAAGRPGIGIGEPASGIGSVPAGSVSGRSDIRYRGVPATWCSEVQVSPVSGRSGSPASGRPAIRYRASR
jgi:hypothetical protein